MKTTLLALSIVATCCGIMAQPQTMQTNMPMLVVGPTPHPLINIYPFTAASEPVLSRALTDKTAPFQNMYGVLANQSDKAVVALVTVWQFYDQNGRKRSVQFTCDSYRGSHAPVALAHSKLLLTPVGVVPLQFAEERGSTGYTTLDPLMLQHFSGATQSQMQVDLIVFQDGETAGPDTRYVSSDITARYRAAKAVASALRTALSSGQSASSAMSTFKVSPEVISKSLTREDIQQLTWQVQYAREVMMAPSPDSMLRYLDTIVQPASLYRR